MRRRPDHLRLVPNPTYTPKAARGSKVVATIAVETPFGEGRVVLRERPAPPPVTVPKGQPAWRAECAYCSAGLVVMSPAADGALMTAAPMVGDVIECDNCRRPNLVLEIQPEMRLKVELAKPRPA